MIYELKFWNFYGQLIYTKRLWKEMNFYIKFHLRKINLLKIYKENHEIRQNLPTEFTISNACTSYTKNEGPFHNT